MKMKKVVLGLFFTFTPLILFGCTDSKASSDILENDSTYIGKSGTSEIIVVDSKDSWTIKDRHEDDLTYSVVKVSETDEKVDDYTVINLVATEIKGDETPFARREGREFIIAEDDEGLYFRTVVDDNKESLSEDLSNAEDKIEYIKDVANFRFTKQ